MRRAETVLQPLFRRYPSVDLPNVVQRELPARYSLFLIAIAVAVFGGVISPVVWRGGLLLQRVGFAAVTADGIEVSRSRALCRALLAWLPASAYILMSARHAVVQMTVQRTDPIMALFVRPVPWPVTGMPLIVLVAVIVGGVWAACRPSRGAQDWMTGTWLVPR